MVQGSCGWQLMAMWRHSWGSRTVVGSRELPFLEQSLDSFGRSTGFSVFTACVVVTS
jgi:hypothetical protein